MQNELVKTVGDNIFTDSMVIAKGTKNQHESIQRRIRDYETELLTFGKVGFEIRATSNGQDMKIYLLNEQQATFLITLLKNTKVVVKFKLELVKQFYIMRQALFQKQSVTWQATRLESKEARKLETGEIKQLVEYARTQGSKNAAKYYINLSKLANKTVGLSGAQRDQASINQLNTLILVENIINNVIQEGIKQQLPYKSIYKNCKARLQEFQEIAYLGSVIGKIM